MPFLPIDKGMQRLPFTCLYSTLFSHLRLSCTIKAKKIICLLIIIKWMSFDDSLLLKTLPHLTPSFECIHKYKIWVRSWKNDILNAYQLKYLTSMWDFVTFYLEVWEQFSFSTVKLKSCILLYSYGCIHLKTLPVVYLHTFDLLCFNGFS